MPRSRAHRDTETAREGRALPLTAGLGDRTAALLGSAQLSPLILRGDHKGLKTKGSGRLPLPATLSPRAQFTKSKNLLHANLCLQPGSST